MNVDNRVFTEFIRTLTEGKFREHFKAWDYQGNHWQSTKPKSF